MGSTLFRDPQARSSALAALGTLQPRAFGSLNRVDPLDSVSNYYIAPPTTVRAYVGIGCGFDTYFYQLPHPWGSSCDQKTHQSPPTTDRCAGALVSLMQDMQVYITLT